MIKLVAYKFYSFEEKILFWFVLLIILQFVQLGFNFSFYLFPFFIYHFFISKNNSIRPFDVFSLLAIAFAIGSVLSYIHSTDQEKSSLVLLNYIYWAFILILFGSLKDKLSFKIIFDAVLVGLVLSALYYHILKHIGFQLIPIFKDYSQNAFSFLAICFAPIATYNFSLKNGKVKAVIFGISLVIISFLSGSRAGSILVILGVIGALLMDNLRLRFIIIMGLIAFVFGNAIITLPFVRNVIYELNQRTYDVVYNFEEVLETDRSYLIRRAMVEKGIEIFEKNQKYGIGLNTFQGYQIDLPGNFVGSEYVIDKNNLYSIGSHNSYINLLAEGGYYLFIPFILILLSILIPGLLNFFVINDFQRVILLSTILMSIHFYFVSSILNSMPWFVISLGFLGVSWGNKRKFK